MRRLPKIPLSWAVAATASFLAFFVATAPATLVSAVVRRASGGRVVLSDCQGTLWTGAGTLTVLGQQDAGVSLQTSWSLHPSTLVLGRISADVSASGSGGSVAGRVDIGHRSVSLRRFAASLPAAWIGLAGLPPLLGQPDGRVRIESSAFRLRPGRVDGDAVVTWQNASAANAGPLGSFRLTVAGHGADADLVLETIEAGGLTATGRGRWSATTGDARLDGSLSTEGTAGAHLAPLLDIVAPENDGRRAFNLAGRLPLPF